MKLSNIESFCDKFSVRKLSECWNWKTPDKNGYGSFRCKYAHRVMWEFENGQIPNGLWVLHKCDNPSCVNPNHLFLGTHTDNMRDMNQKHRRNNVGERNAMSKLTIEQVQEIRLSGDKQRELASRFGVHQSLISLIKSGKIWK